MLTALAATDDGSTDWEAIARRRLRIDTEIMGEKFSGELASLGHRIEAGDASRDDLMAVRTRMEELISRIEDELAPVVPGAEPYNSVRAHYIPNSGYAADYFDITTKQATEAREGAIIELRDVVRKQIAAGHTVQVETEAGIEVALTPERPERVQYSVTLDEDDLRRLLNGENVQHTLTGGQSIDLETEDVGDKNTGP